MDESNPDDPGRIDPGAPAAPGTTRQADDAPTVVNPPAGGVGATGSSAAASVPEGAVIIKDRFILEQRLGRGGMGQVFKARDLRKVEAQDDNPWVAIKFLGEEFSRHPMALVSLQREAKKSQQLAHPNVLTVYDFDRDGDRVYMTMELLQGSPLPGWEAIEFTAGHVPTAASLVREMAEGLAYAHKLGVIHSDFKPENVFVTVDGRVKILDFGIARIMDSAVEKDSFDAGDLGALTYRYASLEMLQGGAEPHPADDVYALGLMAYQLFAGEHPFGGKNALQALEEGLEPAHIRGIRRHQWRAIAGALALRREDRTASAEQFLRQFSGVARRNRYLIVAIIVLACSSGYFAWEAVQPEGPAVPFGKLPPALQQEVVFNLERGQQSAAIQDWDGASRYFMAAYELHPRNPRAEQGLALLAGQLIKLSADMQSDRQKKYLLEMLNAHASNEYLANHAGLKKLRAKLERELAAPASDPDA